MGKILLNERDFEGSLQENHFVLSLSEHEPPGDEALFNIGLIYAHYDNPGKDYKKSHSYFNKLIEKHPQSTFLEQAQILAAILNTLEKTEIKMHKQLEVFKHIIASQKLLVEEKVKKQLEHIEAYEHLVNSRILLDEGEYKGALSESQKVLSLSENETPGDEALFNIGLIFAHYDNPDKDYKKSLGFFQKLISEFPQSFLKEQAKIWVGVLDVIEKSKQVDIEIEKKKELTR
jgi:tetratricopeptide (TPR) repeat protein